jgi:hypothetical protein
LVPRSDWLGCAHCWSLDADEVVRFLEAVPTLKSRAALTAAYTAGLSHLTGQGYYDHDSTATTR